MPFRFRRRAMTTPLAPLVPANVDKNGRLSITYPCDFASQDSITVRSLRDGPNDRPGVSVLIADGDSDESLSVVLTPANAYRLAAAILNAADDASGREKGIASLAGGAK
jgi:hypothetical protein